MTTPSLLDIRDVSKSFGGVNALERVSLHVERGKILGLIGPNGAGKTTLFHVIAGAIRPDSGTLVFDGRDISALRPDERCALGIARTFQIPRPFAEMSVRDNIEVALRFRMKRGANMPSADRLMEQFGLAQWADVDAASIPLGGKKRLEFARALATGPKLLLLDEVMGGLRPNEINDLMQTIRDVRQAGITIVMIEHVMRAVMALCDRIVVLHHGERIASGTPAEIVADHKVIEAYLGAAHAAP